MVWGHLYLHHSESRAQIWGGFSCSEDKSLWLLQRYPHLEDQAREGNWGVGGFFPNLMGLLDPWEEPVALSWVPHPDTPSLPPDSSRKRRWQIKWGGVSLLSGKTVPEGKGAVPPNRDMLYRPTHMYTPLHPTRDIYETDTHHMTYTPTQKHTHSQAHRHTLAHADIPGHTQTQTTLRQMQTHMSTPPSPLPHTLSGVGSQVHQALGLYKA